MNEECTIPQGLTFETVNKISKDCLGAVSPSSDGRETERSADLEDFDIQPLATYLTEPLETSTEMRAAVNTGSTTAPDRIKSAGPVLKTDVDECSDDPWENGFEFPDRDDRNNNVGRQRNFHRLDSQKRGTQELRYNSGNLDTDVDDAIEKEDESDDEDWDDLYFAADETASGSYEPPITIKKPELWTKTGTKRILKLFEVT